MAPRSDSPLLFEPVPLRPDFRMEKRAIADGLWPVAGIDEAGRGPLAGPVVAAAVILDPKRIPRGLDDSKRLDMETREAVFQLLLERALAVSFASICAHSIDTSDIRKATLEAMRRATAGLAVPARYALVDGNDVPPDLGVPAKALVKGDQRSKSVAAASIVAKVVRDRIMTTCGTGNPQYGFEFHMGYATERHRTAIAAAGPLARLHRLSFAPFRLQSGGLDLPEG